MSSSSSTTPAAPYEVQERDVLVSSNTRYQVLNFTGEGYFGTVAKCLNVMTGEQVAVKIHKDDGDYFIHNELEMLNEIRALDPDRSNIVTFFEGFRFHNLSCLTFEILDKSLLDVMRVQQRTMHLNEIRPITHQLLVAFEALKSIGIVHLDLKPDNILFVNHRDHPFRLKLIDFGLAQRVSEVQAEMIIQPFSYQAPEVSLGLPLSEAMDMWGVGCVMAFMYFGANLLPHHCPYDWMRTIVHLLGQPPDHLLDAGKYTSTFFVKKDDGSPGWRLKTSDEYFETTYVEAEVRRRIFDYAKNLDDAVQSYPEEREDVEYKDRMEFLNLLKSCLNLDPQKRTTPGEAIMTPFISMLHLVDVMATSSHADEALQIMYDSHLKHLVESDDSLSDSDMDSSYWSLTLAEDDSDIESYGDGDMDAEDEDQHAEDRSSDTGSCIGEDTLNDYDAKCCDDSSTDGEPHTSADGANVQSSDIESYGDGDMDAEDEDQHAEDRSSDTDSCIGEDTLNDYDAKCSDDSSTDGEPHTSADGANVQSSADEDVKEPDSLPQTDDNIVPVYSYASGGGADSLPPSPPTSDSEMFHLDISSISSWHDEVSDHSSLSHEESGATPTSTQISELTDCGPIASEHTLAAVDASDGATANISKNDGAATNISTNEGDAANISTNDGVAANISTNEGDAANISTNDGVTANISTNEGDAANISTNEGAAANISTNDAAVTQPAVQKKKFRKVRKFFSRIRRRVVSFFTN